MTLHNLVSDLKVALQLTATIITVLVLAPLWGPALWRDPRGRLEARTEAAAAPSPQRRSRGLSRVSIPTEVERRQLASKLRGAASQLRELRVLWALAVASATQQVVRCSPSDCSSRSTRARRSRSSRKPAGSTTEGGGSRNVVSGRHPKLQSDAEYWFDVGYSKIRTIAVTQGVFRAARVLKDFASEMRSAWMGDRIPSHFLLKGSPSWLPPVRSAAALSFIGRALPVGQDLEAKKATAEFIKNSVTPFPVSQVHLDGLRSFARDWARRYLPKNPQDSDTLRLLTSGSASYSRTRAQGGIKRELLDQLDAASAAGPDIEKPSFVPWSTWSVVTAEATQLRAARDALAGLPLPKGRLAIVRQRGLKTRVVTAMSPEHLVLGHMARRRLFMGLRKWPLVADVLKGNVSEAVRSLQGATGRVLSSDLVSASDLIPRSVAEAIADGLRASGRLTAFEQLGLDFGVGDADITCDVAGSENFRSKRGILMGYPTTWAVLCLYHGWAWSHAVDYHRLCSTVSGPDSLRPKARARICGDDLLGIALPGAIRAYESALRETGAQISEGKHYNTSSRGLFLEKLWEMRGVPVTVTDSPLPIYRKLRGARKKGKKTLVRVDTYQSIRVTQITRSYAGFSLQGFIGSLDFESPLRSECGPPSWMTRSFTESALLEEGFSWRRISAVGRTLDPGLSTRFRRAGIPPFLPRALGGGGLAGPPDASRSHRRALSSLLYGQGKTIRPDLSFERCWAPYNSTSDRTASELLGCLGVGKVRALDEPAPYGMAAVGQVDDVFSKAIAFGQSAEDFLLGAFAPRMVYPSLNSLGRRVKEVRGRLLKLWLSAEPVKLRVPVLLSRWRARKKMLLYMPLTYVDPETRQPPPGSPPCEFSEFIWLATPGLRGITRRLAIYGLAGDPPSPATWAASGGGGGGE